MRNQTTSQQFTARHKSPKNYFAIAPYQNPQPDFFDFQDEKTVRLCNAMALLCDEIGISIASNNTDDEVIPRALVSPVALWVQIYEFARAIQMGIGELKPEQGDLDAPDAPLNAMRHFLTAQKDWGAVLFARRDPIGIAEAMNVFLVATLERCRCAFDAAQRMFRYRQLDSATLAAEGANYAHIGEKTTSWSIFDFDFLPLRDLRAPATVAGGTLLTFEATGFVPTQNSMGYMTSCLDPFSHAFTWHSQDFPQLTKPALEIGAAFGVATIPALRAGAHVVANDLNPQHLQILEHLTPPHLRGNLTTRAQRFPEALEFAPESFSCILAARVLHFLTVSQLQRASELMAGWLEPGGHVFVVADSPYLGNVTSFRKEYEARKAAGDAYPGMHKNVAKTFTSRSDKLPDLFHFFDPEVLARTFENVGLEVINCRFFPRLDYPADVRLDGREGVGLIARKPMARADHNAVTQRD